MLQRNEGTIKWQLCKERSSAYVYTENNNKYKPDSLLCHENNTYFRLKITK